jgi:glyoxylase-like metal-dependent hydrolase (beta-lactamase superfamily II)
MAKIHILIEGQGSDFKSKTITHYPTTVLIESGENKIIFDPGVDRKMLVQSLNNSQLTIDNINYVFLSHHHLDHSLMAGIFSNAKVILGNTWYKDTTEVEYDNDILGPEISIIKTSGHTSDDACLLVQTDKEKVLLAGDMFWWPHNEKQENTIDKIIKHKDMFAVDQKKLEIERRRLILLADLIIPGHGKPFSAR